MTVTVVRISTGKRLVLNALRRQMFTRELAMVKRRPPIKTLPPRLAPDLRITVKIGKRRTEYDVYSAALLWHPKSKQGWMFYFAVLLRLWIPK
jgi:hypothetical protein